MTSWQRGQRDDTLVPAAPYRGSCGDVVAPESWQIGVYVSCSGFTATMRELWSSSSE